MKLYKVVGGRSKILVREYDVKETKKIYTSTDGSRFFKEKEELICGGVSIGSFEAFTLSKEKISDIKTKICDRIIKIAKIKIEVDKETIEVWEKIREEVEC